MSMLDNMSNSHVQEPCMRVCFSGGKETRGEYKGPAVYLQSAHHIDGQKRRMDSLSPNLLSAFWGKLAKHLAQFLHL